MSVLIDSCGWINFFAGSKDGKKYATYIKQAKKESNITPTVVAYEVYKQIKKEEGESKALDAHAAILNSTTLVDLTADIALSAADISLEYKIGMGDAIVVATARKYSAQIITNDPDLKQFDHVTFIQ